MSHSAPSVPSGGDQLKREFTLWSAFAFAFAYISPIVALYTIFGIAYGAAGPAFWWSFFVVLGGQLLVALVFGELVSRWPIEGSIYQWSSRLLGKGFGWAAGWVYMWTLIVAMSALASFAAVHLASAFGWELGSTGQGILACIVLVIGTATNIAGRSVLKSLMIASIIAEVIGSLGLSVWLLIFHRENSLGVLTTGLGADGYFTLSGPFFVAMAFIGWSFVGFESSGSIAEEVKRPRVALPKAMIFSLIFIAVVVMFSALAVILSIPEEIAATSADPVYDTLAFHLGTGAAKGVEILFTISFVASFLALQTAASRLIWSYARDRALPAPDLLSKLTPGQKQPIAALAVATVLGAIIIVLGQLTPDFFTLLVNFTSGGFYLAFLFALVANFAARMRGTWQPGPFSLGPWSLPVSVVALAWTAFEFVNIAWPRNLYPDTPYLNWSILLAAVGLGVIGTVVYRLVATEITPFHSATAFDDDGEGEDPTPDSEDRMKSVPR